MKQLTDICHIPVKFSEIDSMRIVWHGNYVAYFEDGRESFSRRYPGIGYDTMQKKRYLCSRVRRTSTSLCFFGNERCCYHTHHLHSKSWSST